MIKSNLNRTSNITFKNAAAELFDAYVLYPEQNILDNVNRVRKIRP